MHVRAICIGMLDLFAPRLCPGCDAPRVDAVAFCDVCTPLLERLPKGAPAVYEYGGPLAEAIQRLKYEGRSDLAAPLGGLMAAACGSWLGRVDVIAPVPLARRRRRERGFDQAALLAKALARSLDLPLRVNLLRRVRDTPSQVGRPLAERLDNMRGAFVARPDGQGLRVLLVDDVRTTGATLSAGAMALRQAGAAQVRTLALAASV